MMQLHRYEAWPVDFLHMANYNDMPVFKTRNKEDA